MPKPPPKEYAGNVPPGKRPFTANIDQGLHERMRVGSALLGSNMGARPGFLSARPRSRRFPGSSHA